MEYPRNHHQRNDGSEGTGEYFSPTYTYQQNSFYPATGYEYDYKYRGYYQIYPQQPGQLSSFHNYPVPSPTTQEGARFLHGQTYEGADRSGSYQVDYQSGISSDSGFDLSNKPTVRIYCKCDPTFHVTVRGEEVVLAPADPCNEFQNWLKDQRYTRMKDAEGFPSFALVNKATGQAISRSQESRKPVQLTPYNPNVVDESVLWTESRDLGDGYRTVRPASNLKQAMQPIVSDKKATLHDGFRIYVWLGNGFITERWKITTPKKFFNRQ